MTSYQNRLLCLLCCIAVFCSSYFLPRVNLYQQIIGPPPHYGTKRNAAAAVPLSPNSKEESISLEKELSTCFLSYAMSIILGRALPDARDGLKPVHRRILWAMRELHLDSSSPYRKCARVVGEVLGKFHPHGDAAVYDALVRMAQDFVMRQPLVSGHGNFGSIDGDPPAAMRYTECRLSPFSQKALLEDLEQNTVDIVPNFDGNEVEPSILPVKLPLLLLNGATGIAVGMATNIPPHNLNELIDGCIALIKQPELSEGELIRIIPAPDFPSGGKIVGLNGARNLYTKGSGSILMRATCHHETLRKSKSSEASIAALVLTELPYLLNKSSFIEKVAQLVNDKRIEGIADIRDESDRSGMRIVLELKRGSQPSIVERNLYKYSMAQNSFAGNFLAVGGDGKRPVRLTLRSAIQNWLSFRFQTVRRRSAYELKRKAERVHVLEGLVKAILSLDFVIETVRTSKDAHAAQEALQHTETLNVSKVQAEAILKLTLGRLTALEEKAIAAELDDLVNRVTQLKSLMEEDSLVYAVISEELKEIRKKFNSPRRSEIIPEAMAELSTEDLIPNNRSILTVTSLGYVKRLPVEDFEAQTRGTRGKASVKLRNEQDGISLFVACSDHDTLLWVSKQGVAFTTKAHQIPFSSREGRGVPLVQVLPVSRDNDITAVLPISQFQKGEFLVLLTKKGWVKKTPLGAFQNVSQRGLTLLHLEEHDSLPFVKHCRPSDSILIATKQGYTARFDEASLRATSRSSRGVKAIRQRLNDSIVDMDIVPSLAEDQKDTATASLLQFLVITEKGFGKRFRTLEIRKQRRPTRGVRILRFKKNGNEDHVAGFRVCAPGDQVMISTRAGTVVRQNSSNIALQRRIASGVLVQKLQDGDLVKSLTIVPACS